MTAVTTRVERWKRVWRDVADAVAADDLVLCDGPTCDCDVPPTAAEVI